MRLFYFIGIIVSVFFVSGCVEPDDTTSSLDETKPVITLKGDHTVILESEEEFRNYVDPGATAWDDRDGNITDKIEVSILISSSTEIDFTSVTFVYDVEDLAGNRAESVNRGIYIKKQ